MGSRTHRTLADQLRAWPEQRLLALLRDRPDLATPAPHDSGQLASRCATRSSLSRALDRLDRLALTVLDALVVQSQTTRAEIAAIVHAEPLAVGQALDRLEALALVWVSPSGLRALSGVAEALRTPASLGPEAGVSGVRPRSSEPASTGEIERRLALLSAPARALLDHVDAEGGEGISEAARRTVRPEDAAGPVEELISRGVLVHRGERTVQVPGEVGLVLRGGRTTRDRVDVVPPLATADRDPALVARAAAGAAFEAVRRTELLLDAWGAQPPTALRNGGLGVRDLKAAAALLHVGEDEAALLVEIAAEAGLLATGLTPEGDASWLPTDEFDTWSVAPVAERWVRLAAAWWATTRLPGLAGTRDEAGRAANALAPESASVYAVESRQAALAVLAEAPPGTGLAAGTGIPSLVARVAWQRPRRPRSRADQVVWALREAAVLGLTGLDALAEHGRLLVHGEGAGAAAALAPLLPAPVDHVLIQADLTAVAPGPLEASVGRSLHLVAEVESRGGATVYRFTSGSVRRALDAGWSAAEVHAFLASVSRTPVPQPLTYLVDDVVRTFGSLRVGHAEAFLRADDEAALTELLHHARAGSLGLRRIAPTVLVSSTPLDLLLPRLRELGAAPVVESADGSIHVARPDQLRARTPRRTPSGAREAHTEAQLAAAVSALRAGDRAASLSPARMPAGGVSAPGLALAALRDAVEAGQTVLIGYVDNHGTASERLVDPMRVEGGHLTAHDHRSEGTRSFAVHRITSVTPVSPASPASPVAP